MGETKELYSYVIGGHWASLGKVHECEQPHVSLWMDVGQVSGNCPN